MSCVCVRSSLWILFLFYPFIRFIYIFDCICAFVILDLIL